MTDPYNPWLEDRPYGRVHKPMIAKLLISRLLSFLGSDVLSAKFEDNNNGQTS